jgi:hypothetical protein
MLTTYLPDASDPERQRNQLVKGRKAGCVDGIDDNGWLV